MQGTTDKDTTHLLSWYGFFEIITSINNLVIFLFRSFGLRDFIGFNFVS